MNSCENYEEAISALTDGELSSGEEQELRAHLQDCQHCTSLLADMTAIHTAFPPMVQPPKTLLTGTLYLRSVETAAPSRRKRVISGLVGVAACLLLALFMSSRSSGDPITPAHVEETALPSDATMFAQPFVDDGASDVGGNADYIITDAADESKEATDWETAGGDDRTRTEPIEGIPPDNGGKTTNDSPIADPVNPPDPSDAQQKAGTDIYEQAPSAPVSQATLEFFDAIPPDCAVTDAAFYAELWLNADEYELLFQLTAEEDGEQLRSKGYFLAEETELFLLAETLPITNEYQTILLDQQYTNGIVKVSVVFDGEGDH